MSATNGKSKSNSNGGASCSSGTDMEGSDSEAGGSLKAAMKTHFGTSCPYEVLGADKKATEEQLKKAYRKRSLSHHPDRPDGDKERFQTLSAVYKMLADKDRRAVYDETGEIDEGDDMDPDKDWDQYWRLLFKVYESSFKSLSSPKPAYVSFRKSPFTTSRSSRRSTRALRRS